jgi:hypothetical protein
MEIIDSNNRKCQGCPTQNKQKFFSDSVSTLIEILNYTVAFSFTFSKVFWVFSKFLLYKDRARLLDEELITVNIINYLFIIAFISLGFLSIQKRSLGLLTAYLLALIAINLNFIFEFSSTLNFEMFNEELKFANTLLITTFTILSFLISLCLIFKHLNFASKAIYNLESFSIHEFIHEAKLKLDLLKIKINSFVIIIGLHKFLPFILFKKSDFYFMTEESNYIIIKKENKKSEYKENSGVFINSRSTIDSETEPLK